MKIEVLGPGCKRCLATEENVKEALRELGIEAEIIKIKDFKEIMDYGVMFTPAVAINGAVRVSGKIPSVEEIKEIIEGL